jgi:hypothetical protein
MNHFSAALLFGHTVALAKLSERLKANAVFANAMGKPSPKVEASEMETLETSLKAIKQHGKFGTLPVRVEFFLTRISSGAEDVNALAAEIETIKEAVSVELFMNSFLRIVPERSGFVDQPLLLGEAVASAFPSAVPDIKQAGSCLAAECNTAAVFHLMRAVEWGLRSLCSHFGIRRVRNKFKKSGKKGSYVPIEYLEWERILDELQDRIDKRIQKLKRGPAKQEFQALYYPVLLDIRGIRDAWRNHVMHTRAEYNHEDADAILGHVKRLMATLASRISEL